MASKYKIHPAANIFPMLSDDDFAALKADIEANGQLDDIAFFEDMVIDGRNRLRACEELGIDPQWYELTECKDPVAYVLSKNLHRRHLTPSQAGMCAAKAKDYYDQQAKERMKEGGKKGGKCKGMEKFPDPSPEQTARDAAGKAFGVSGKQVDKAAKVLASGCAETIAAVESGKVSVDAAAQLVAAVPDKREQAKVVKEGKKAVAAKVKEAKQTKSRKPKIADPSGGGSPVTSGGLTGTEPDSAGVDSEPDKSAIAKEFSDWLRPIIRRRFDNDNGDLTLAIISNGLYLLSEEVVNWKE